MRIQSGRELHNLLVSLLGEQHGTGFACPWCKELGAYEVDDEATSDRLFISSKIEANRHPIRVVCRQANDGLVDHHAVHNIEELFSEFSHTTLELAPGVTWRSIANQLLAIVGVSVGNGEIDPSRAYWNFLQMYAFHQDPRTYTEWAKLGYSRKTVDDLFLGVLPNGRLSIPIPYLAYDPLNFGLYPLSDTYVQRSRLQDGVEPSQYDPKYYWPSGLPTSLWYVPQRQVTQEEVPCRIFEGDTSTLAGYEIWGDGPLATATAGAGSWSDRMSEYLLARGHTKFHIYSDNDKAGGGYEGEILEQFEAAAERRHVDWNTLEFKLVRWPEDAPEKYDPRQVLLEYGPEQARKLLEQWVSIGSWRKPLENGHTTAEYDIEYAQSDYDSDYQQLRESLYELDVLRGKDGEHGLIYNQIGDFVENYSMTEDNKGLLLLIRATLGVGKTRAAVHYAEDYARWRLAKRKKRATATLQRLYAIPEEERTPKIKARIEKYEQESYQKLSVAFIGPYLDGFQDIERHSTDISLWYNVSARNKETCQNYALTEEVANAGYGVMETCCIEGGICPLRQQCLGKYEGRLQYLAQLEEALQYPIVYLRHQHLYMKDLLQKTSLVIVDEDPSAVALTPVTLTLSELKRFDARLMLEGEEATVVNRFMLALQNAVEIWATNKMLMGRALVQRLTVKQGDRSLHELAEYIARYGLLDKIAKWRPMNFETAPSGKLVELLKLVVRDVLRDEEDWNAQVFIESQCVTFYTMAPFEIAPNKPVIALDGTGMEHKYKLMFDRAVMPFRAEVFPENLKTYTIINSENTMSVLHREVPLSEAKTSRSEVRDKMTAVEKARPQNYAVFDGSTLPNPAMREAIRMVLGLTAKHDQLLVVTYKQARQYMENFIQENFPDYTPYIGWGHFRALRGLNIFENIPAALIIGTFRIPRQVLQRDLIAFHKDDPELLDLTFKRVDEYYHYTPWRYSTLTMADARKTVQDYIYEMEAGELQQVAGRIRGAVSDTEKHVYLMSARPAMQWMTYTNSEKYDPKRDPYFTTIQSSSWYWFEAEQAVGHIVHFYTKHGRRPTIRELAEISGYSEWTARKTLEFWDSKYEEK